MRKRLVTFFSLVGLTLTVAPAALAKYPGGGVQGASAGTGGSLPFTGINLVLVVAGAALLLLAGLYLRRRAASDS
jgi:LPXTG-motif cell wall-anchored protein